MTAKHPPSIAPAKPAPITIDCPGGHRLRGDASLQGKMICCPKCQQKFVFPVVERSEITDTGIMKILGDVAPLPEPPTERIDTKRPCPRCRCSISIASNVCSHCDCYVGAMPEFMRQIGRQ